MVFRALAFIFLVAVSVSANADTAVNVELGLGKDGKPTNFWMEAIRGRVSPDVFALISERKKKLSAQEIAWADKIQKTIPLFKKELPNLELPFAAVGPLEKAILVFGNQGGPDGFTCSLEHICLDLSQWALNYGQPTESESTDRILRILSHEYTHLLTKLHLGLNPYEPTNALEKALLDLYVEGLGHYYSLSSKWISPRGELSDLSKERLQQSEKVFITRLKLLKEDERASYAQLTAGMNDGKFEQKWGALPIALWLSKETGRDPLKLRSWVDRGPFGVLALAQAHIHPTHLSQLMSLSEETKKMETKEVAFAAKHEGYVFFAVAALIVFLVSITRFWRGSIVFGLRGLLKKPDLLTASDQFHNLLIPSIFSLSIICALLFVALGVGHLILAGITGLWFDYDRATFVTVQAGTMAILFPLVILILDSSDESHSLVVSKREVLLRHALAFPIGLTLLIFSLYFVFNGAPILATAATIICVSLSLWALYRLLEITFSFEVAKAAEEKILKARIHGIAADDLAERISFKQTEKAIKQLGGPIDFEHHVGILLEDRSDLDLIKIESDSGGLVSSISLRKLRFAVKSLEQLLKQPGAPTPSASAPFRISITAYPGKTLNDREGRELATLILPQGYGSEDFRKKLKETVTKAIKVSTFRSKRSAALDTLMTKLGQSGRIAVRDGNLDLMNSVKETFELLYINISDLLDKHKSSLDGIEDPRTSRTFGGKTSNPFESLIDQLMQLQREVTHKKDVDEQVMDRAVYIPHSLAYEALSRGDKKAYGSILSVADVQLGSSVYNKSEPRFRTAVIEWLSGILKYKLLSRRRKKIKSQLDDEKMELARWTVIRLQTAAKCSLDANDIGNAKMAIVKIHDLLEPYKHDTYEHSIETLKWRLEDAGLPGDERAKAAEELERQQAAMMTEKILRSWYEISLVAIAGYALQCIEGANHGQYATKENAEEVLKYCVGRLPSSFQRVVELQLYAQDHGDPDKWGWGNWESHRRNQVYHPHTETYLQRIFALLFYRAATNISPKFAPSSYKLNTQSAWPFRKDERGIRPLVQRVPESVEGKTVGIQAVTPEQLEKTVSLFDEIEREAQLQDDLLVVNQELMPEKIESFKNDFAKAFSEHAVFRHLVTWSPANQKKERNLGTFVDECRDTFIEKPKIGTSGAGDHHGEGLATGEDENVFHELLNLVPKENVKSSVSDAAKDLISKGVRAETIRVFVSHKLLRSLEKDDSYIPNHRLRDRKFPKFIRGIYVVDGVEIPVVMIMVTSLKLDQGVFVTSLNQISLTISNAEAAEDLIAEFHIYLKVLDPVHNDNLQKQLLERDKNNFKGIDPQLWPRLTGRRVYVDIREGLDVNVQDPKRLFKIQPPATASQGEDDGEE